uniref:Uncharacterized protein n=1 Tax=Haematobia irritans TaxID=7368 RepID=A0A1L8EJB4_HAEIR
MVLFFLLSYTHIFEVYLPLMVFSSFFLFCSFFARKYLFFSSSSFFHLFYIIYLIFFCVFSDLFCIIYFFEEWQQYNVF